MRITVVASLALALLAGCNTESLPGPGDLAGADLVSVDAGGGGQADLSGGAQDLAGVTDLAMSTTDLAGQSCVPTGNCQAGPRCGNVCCPTGEWCDSSSGSPTCRCGMQGACPQGDICAAPIIGPEQCGFICCGATGPCPQ